MRHQLVIYFVVNLKISIITISYNSVKYIEQTIQSVVSQTWLDKEYIVVDGGSTDGTVDIIKRYADKIDHWVSEPDHGIADAMNKGLALASGDFVIFLHSDDYFVDENSLSAAAQFLSGEYDIFLFNIYLSRNGRRRLYRPRGFNWWMNFKTGVYHQSAICAKALFEKTGNFDTLFNIGMDYDLFLRAYRLGLKASKKDSVLTVMRLEGISSLCDPESLLTRFGEERRIHFKHCSSILMRLIYYLFWSLYPIYRKCKPCL